MADGDCYTRLHRVALMLQGKGWIWSFHEFENYPFGIIPHTTFPFDGLLVLLALILKPFILNPLDWAGLWVSPLLFVFLGSFLFFFQRSSWGREEKNSIYDSSVLLFGLVLLPGMIWATSFGRPDHQSLLMVLIFIALWGEERRWSGPGRMWEIGLALLWGVALWTSLYEPLVVLGCLGGMNLWIRRQESKFFWGVIAIFFLLTQWLEGFRFIHLHSFDQKNLSSWFHTIGETRGVGVRDFVLIFTGLLFLIPFALMTYWSEMKDRKTVLILVGLSVILVGLTIFQRRWLYFSAIPPLLLAAFVWRFLNRRWQWGIGLLFLLNIVISTSEFKNSFDQEGPFTVESKAIAKSIQGEGAILAPWWISPSLLYYSGQPIVASTSHQSIEGISDSAQFFRGTNWVEAEGILRARKVRWVVAYDEDRVLQNASEVLGLPIPENGQLTWASRLWRTRALPTALKLRGATAHLRLYEFIPDQSF